MTERTCETCKYQMANKGCELISKQVCQCLDWNRKSWQPKPVEDKSAESELLKYEIEKLSKDFHEIYMKEARRQGDVRLKDKYEDLTENVKEFDRVLAREVIKMINNAITQTRQQALKEVGELDIDNPYPEDIFSEPTEEQVKRLVEVIKAGGFSPEAVFGSWGRKVWNNCKDELKQAIDQLRNKGER